MLLVSSPLDTMTSQHYRLSFNTDLPEVVLTVDTAWIIGINATLERNIASKIIILILSTS